MTKPDCYACKHRGSVAGSHHSSCHHPMMQGQYLLPLVKFATGRPTLPRVTALQHGINKGWFMWPINFDPVWLESCTGFEEAP
jgi:hypothetical protein